MAVAPDHGNCWSQQPRSVAHDQLQRASRQFDHPLAEDRRREPFVRERRDALTVQNLSERAGVAVSSICEYYPTMESLIAAIFNDYRSEARRRSQGQGSHPIEAATS